MPKPQNDKQNTQCNFRHFILWQYILFLLLLIHHHTNAEYRYTILQHNDNLSSL